MTTTLFRSAAKVPEPRRPLEDADTEPITVPDPDPADTAWILVQRAQAGDADAFGRLYDRYFDTVFRFAYFRVGNRQVAQDIVGDVWLRALRRIGSYTWQGRDFGAWLVTIARNLIADHFKSGRYRLEVTRPDPGRVGDNDRPDDTPGPESAAVGYMCNVALMRAMCELGDAQREVLVLRYLQGLTVAETAAVMGRNEGAVKALTYRAVQTIARRHPELVVS